MNEQQPAATPDPAAPSSGAITQSNDNTMAMLGHLSALSGFVIPFGWIIGPLVIMLMQKGKSEFAYDQARESLNFQITVFIAILICIPLMLVIIGFFLMIAVAIASLVFVIIASIKANNGERYRYPFAFRFVK
jgi:hypothetical protein